MATAFSTTLSGSRRTAMGERARDPNYVLGSLDVLLGKEPIRAADTSFGKLPRLTEVGAVGRAEPTVSAPPTHRRDDEVAGGEPRDAGPHLGDLAQVLVAQDQVRGTDRRAPVLPGDDVVVGPADPDLDDPDPNGSGGERRGGNVNERGSGRRRPDHDRPHPYRPR
jgi:hypothetical protein